MKTKLHRLYKRKLVNNKILVNTLEASLHILEKDATITKKAKDMKNVSSIAVFNSNGQLLVGLRNDDESWTLPGGHSEEGEDPRDAAIRELFEEAGLQADDIEYLGDGLGGRNGDIHIFCYKAILDGEPSSENDPDNECSVWCWVDIADGIPDIILDNLHNKKNITLDLLGLLKNHTASVNIVDEPDEDLFEMSQDTRFPEGEQPDKIHLFPEIDHGKMKKIEGCTVKMSNLFKSSGGFGLSLHEISTPSKGQGFTDNPADNKETENISEDPDLKLGSPIVSDDDFNVDADVEPPYSGFPGPIPVDEDADKKYNILRGASVKMSNLFKEATELDPNLGYRFTSETTAIDSNNKLTEVNVYDKNNNHVAAAIFAHQGNNIVPGYVVVDDDHQRLGIATAIYKYAEQKTGKKVIPSTTQTSEGIALWEGLSKQSSNILAAPIYDTKLIDISGQLGFSIVRVDTKKSIMYIDLVHIATNTYIDGLRDSDGWFFKIKTSRGLDIGEDQIDDPTFSGLAKLLYRISGNIPKLINRSLGKDKNSVALPDSGEVDENKYTDVTYERENVSIPRDPLKEGPIYGR